MNQRTKTDAMIAGICIVVFVVITLGATHKARAQQEETPGAPTVSLPDRPCVPEDEIDALGHFTGYRVRPVMLDADGSAWVVISDAAGHSPPLLGFLWPEHKLFCAIAHGTDKQL